MIGFTGKFLIDAHKRDAEYIANIEALHTFRHKFDRIVSPTDEIAPEDIARECEIGGIRVPDAFVVPEPEEDVKQELGH